MLGSLTYLYISHSISRCGGSRDARIINISIYCYILSLGVVAARDALLTFMVGGPDKYFAPAKDLLSNMGKNVVHCGPVGTGQVGYHMSTTSSTFNCINKVQNL